MLSPAFRARRQSIFAGLGPVAGAAEALGVVRRHLLAMQAITRGLRAPLPCLDISELVAREGLDGSCAMAAQVGVLSEDKTQIEYVLDLGVKHPLFHAGRRIPADDTFPAGRALNSGACVYVRQGDPANDPVVRQLIAQAPDLGAAAILPLHPADEPYGVIGFGFSEARLFGPHERDFFATMSQQCSQALERQILRNREQQLRQAIEQARAEGARFREDFSTLAAHELCTPLTALTLQIRLACRALVAPEKLKPMEVQLRRLGHVVDTMVNAYLLRSDALRLDRATVESLEPIIYDLADSHNRQFTAVSSVLCVESHGPVCGFWDVKQVRLMVAHLLSNACHHAAGKPVTLRLRESPPGWAHIGVQDLGPGIDPAEHGQLFVPSQVPKARSAQGGLGIGLWVVGQLAHAMHGHVRVQSRLGHGCVFSLHLPCQPPPTSVP